MGMEFSLKQLTDDAIELVLGQNDLVYHLLYPDESEPDDPQFDVPADWQFLLIEKSWHGLHFLFCVVDGEDAWPAGFLMNFGQNVGDTDVGYGPARVFTSSEVKEVHEMLQQLDRGELESRFDVRRMMDDGIYPGIWQDEGQESFEWLLVYFNEVKSFFASAASSQLGCVCWLS